MNKPFEKRTFPRIDAQCPVLYRTDETSPWKVARMENVSATGIRLIVEELLPVSTELYIHIKPGSKKSIPEIKAKGVITRTDTANESDYVISCNLKEVSPG